MRLKIAAVLVGWLALVAGLTVWEISQQPPPHKYEQPAKSENGDRPEGETVTNSSPNKDDNKGQQESSWQTKIANHLSEHITDWLLALFTFFLVLYTRRLYTATAALVEADRPHILVIELNMSGLLGAATERGVEFKITYKLQNLGKSPAFVKGFTANVSWALPPEPAYIKPEPSWHIIVPGGIYYTREPIANLFIPEEIARAVAADKTPLYIYGFMFYRDIRGRRYILRFCYLMSFKGQDASQFFSPDGPISYWEYT